MKTIGLIGGLTWYSTIEYYRLLNEGVNKKMGGAHSAKIFLYSVDFAAIRALTEKNDWDAIAEIMVDAAKTIETAGADCLLLGANTMHNIADKVQAAIKIPLINIVDAVADSINQLGLKKVALLGTKYTMLLDFYKDGLTKHGIEMIIPAPGTIDFINDSIYNELGKGIFLPETRMAYLQVIDELQKQGAEGVILGCTEIPLLIQQHHTPLPIFDTGLIHATVAVEFATG